ncbi:MAG: DNA polymerase III subunit epsilon [Pseudomonadota bacterium]
MFIVTDVEVDGPVPGQNSMLSFASVAVSADGAILDDFSAALSPLPDATADPLTLAWLRGQPAVWQSVTDGARTPSDVMTDYVAWIRAFQAEPVFTAHPLAMDGPWIDHYLRRFTGIRLLKGPWQGERLFYDGGLCLRSYAAGRLGWPLRRCTAENYDPDWLGGHAHTHRAIDDATGYAHLLAHLLARSP